MLVKSQFPQFMINSNCRRYVTNLLEKFNQWFNFMMFQIGVTISHEI